MEVWDGCVTKLKILRTTDPFFNKERKFWLEKNKCFRLSQKTLQKNNMSIEDFCNFCFTGKLSEAKSLLEKEFQAQEERSNFLSNNQRDEDGRTPALWAAQGGRVEILEFLAQNNVDLLFTGDTDLGMTPILICAQFGHLPCFEFLVKQAMKNNNNSLQDLFEKTRNDAGDSFLHFAAMRSQKGIFEILLSSSSSLKAATIKYLSTLKNHQGHTALDSAKMYDQKEMEKFLEEVVKTNVEEEVEFA
jgi:ankyrin repeat protein